MRNFQSAPDERDKVDMPRLWRALQADYVYRAAKSIDAADGKADDFITESRELAVEILEQKRSANAEREN